MIRAPIVQGESLVLLDLLMISSEESVEVFEYLSWSERFNVEIKKDDDIVKWMTLSDIASDFSFIAQI